MTQNLRKALAESFEGIDVQQRVDDLTNWQTKATDSSQTDYDHAETVNNFYDLATAITRWGWNESFHFAPIKRGESVTDAIHRHQQYLIAKLQLDDTKQALDVGCGIGGPMRHVVRKTGARVHGININKHQIKVGRSLNKKANLEHLTEISECNFMDLSRFEENFFDAAYAIESTIYAPDKVRAYEEIFRVVKPGAFFWGQETILTTKYNPQNPEHERIKERMKNDLALFELYTLDQIRDALVRVGFHVFECDDLEQPGPDSVPWYKPLTGKGKVLNTSQLSPMRRALTMFTLKCVETLRLVPKGTHAATKQTARVGDALIEGGSSGVFSILACFLAQKPNGDSGSNVES